MVWRRLATKEYGSSSGDVIQTDTFTAKETTQVLYYGEANGGTNSPKSFLNGADTDNNYYSTYALLQETTEAESANADNLNDGSSADNDDAFKMGYLCDVSGEEKLYIGYSHAGHNNNGNVGSHVGKVTTGIGTTITKYGQWDDVNGNDFQTWSNLIVVGGDIESESTANSAVSPLNDLTGVRINSIFTQTDDVPAYYWYQTLDGVTAWFPTFQDSMTDSSVWQPVGSNITITDGVINASGMVTESDNRIYCDIGKTLSTKFVVDFDHYADTASNGAYWQMFALTDTTAVPRTDDDILALVDMGNWTTYLRYSNEGSETNVGSIGNLTTGKWQYVRFVRDGTTGTLTVYSDSARTTQVLNVSGTIPATVTGLRYFQSGRIASGNAGTATYKIKDLKIYDGVTSV